MRIGTEWKEIVAPLHVIMGQFWRTSRITIGAVILGVIASSLVTVSAPYVFSRLIDRITLGEDVETVLTGLVLYALLMGVALTLQHAVSYLAAMSAESLNFMAGTRFFERLVRKTGAFFVEHNPAEIQSAQSKGARALNVVVQLGLNAIAPGVAQLLLTLSVLGVALDPEMAAIVLVYGVVFIALAYFSTQAVDPYRDRAMAVEQENAKLVGNAVTSMETLRYFGSAVWMNQRFVVGAREVFDNWRRFCAKRILYASFYGIALAAQLALTFAFLMPRYRTGAVSVGDIVLFNTLLLQLNRPFEMIGYAIEDLARSYTDFRPFARMWAAPEEWQAAHGAGFVPTDGRLEFRRVGFAYEDGRGIERVSFVANRGRINFITGETGGGKSTVFKLALKSLEPNVGEIRVDGIDLLDIDRDDWYRSIGVVPQDILLLNDTLATNIALGRPLDDERLRAAAARAAILDRIEALPAGFETVVGERGLKLSGGERQRVAIARALYAEPKILFLDEASSALDDTTEREIMDHIRSIADDVTVLAITHRNSPIRANDQVIRLASRGEGQRPRDQSCSSV